MNVFDCRESLTRRTQPLGSCVSSYLSGDASLDVGHELRAQADAVSAAYSSTPPLLLLLFLPHTAVYEVYLLRLHIWRRQRDQDKQTESVLKNPSNCL